MPVIEGETEGGIGVAGLECERFAPKALVSNKGSDSGPALLGRLRGMLGLIL
jgi:hypothetical protein